MVEAQYVVLLQLNSLDPIIQVNIYFIAAHNKQLTPFTCFKKKLRTLRNKIEVNFMNYNCNAKITEFGHLCVDVICEKHAAPMH